MSKRPLGIEVSNSDPAPRAGFSRNPETGSVPSLTPTELARNLRPLQAASQAQRCGAWIGGKARLTTYADSSMGFVGYYSSCGSPRCPRCRVGLMDRRQGEIQACIDWWTAKPALDFRVSMITLTAPHYQDQSLPRFLGSTAGHTGIMGALALLKKRYIWKKHVREYVSGQETTHGRNGWHVHYHILVFHVGELDKDAWYLAWAKACKDAGLGKPSQAHGLTIQNAENAATYMAKWGIASEAVGAHHKEAKNGNEAIWTLETRAASGDAAARNILKKYYRAMRGMKVHTFSRGLLPVRLHHRLGLKPNQAHYLLDTASSFWLHEDTELKSLILRVLEDYPMPVLEVFEQLGLVAKVNSDDLAPQLPHEVTRRGQSLINRESKYPDMDIVCLNLLLEKKKHLVSLINEHTIDDILDRLAWMDETQFAFGEDEAVFDWDALGDDFDELEID